MKILRMIIALVLFISVLAVEAQVATFNTNRVSAATTTNLLTTQGWYISKVDIVAPAGNSQAVTVRFYDNKYPQATFTNAAYTTRVSYPTNFTRLYTNTLGSVQTNSYVGTYTSNLTVAQSDVTALPTLLSVTVPAGATSSTVVDLSTVKGLVMAADTNANVTVHYRQYR